MAPGVEPARWRVWRGKRGEVTRKLRSLDPNELTPFPPQFSAYNTLNSLFLMVEEFEVGLGMGVRVKVRVICHLTSPLSQLLVP